MVTHAPIIYEPLYIGVHRRVVSLSFKDRSFNAELGVDESQFRKLDVLREAGNADRYGVELSRSVFGRRLSEELARSLLLDEETRERQRLSIRLRVSSDRRLLSICWENLFYLGPPPIRFACDRFTPLSRYVRRHCEHEPVRERRLRVLLAVADPVIRRKGGHLSTSSEDAAPQTLSSTVSSTLERASDAVCFEVLEHFESLDQLLDTIESGGFHVVHLIAPTSSMKGREHLLFEGRARRAVSVSINALAEAMRSERAASVRLLVQPARDVSSPESHETTGALVRGGVPAVLCLPSAWDDREVRSFAEAFYLTLAGSPTDLGRVDSATNQARQRLFANAIASNRRKFELPILYLRGDGLLFSPSRHARPIKPLRIRPAVDTARRPPEPLSPAAAQVHVFISYSHNAEDSKLKEELFTKLRALKEEYGLRLFVDNEIRGGANFSKSIEEELLRADLVLLLLSDEFLGSENCKMEMETAFGFDNRTTRFAIPILLRPSVAVKRDSRLKNRHIIPVQRNSGRVEPRAVSRWSDGEQAWEAVCADIVELLEQRRRHLNATKREREDLTTLPRSGFGYETGEARMREARIEPTETAADPFYRRSL